MCGIALVDNATCFGYSHLCRFCGSDLQPDRCLEKLHGRLSARRRSVGQVFCDEAPLTTHLITMTLQRASDAVLRLHTDLDEVACVAGNTLSGGLQKPRLRTEPLPGILRTCRLVQTLFRLSKTGLERLEIEPNQAVDAVNRFFRNGQPRLDLRSVQDAELLQSHHVAFSLGDRENGG